MQVPVHASGNTCFWRWDRLNFLNCLWIIILSKKSRPQFSLSRSTTEDWLHSPACMCTADSSPSLQQGGYWEAASQGGSQHWRWHLIGIRWNDKIHVAHRLWKWNFLRTLAIGDKPLSNLHASTYRLPHKVDKLNLNISKCIEFWNYNVRLKCSGNVVLPPFGHPYVSFSSLKHWSFHVHEFLCRHLRLHVSSLLSVDTIVVFLFMQMWSVWLMSVATFTLVASTLGQTLLNPFTSVVAPFITCDYA